MPQQCVMLRLHTHKHFTLTWRCQGAPSVMIHYRLFFTRHITSFFTVYWCRVTVGPDFSLYFCCAFPYQDEHSLKGPCWWAENRDANSDPVLPLRHWGLKPEKWSTCRKSVVFWGTCTRTFRKVLASSFLQRSNLVTLCSNHCCTTALLSAESPSRSGRLASLARWQAMVPSPTSTGPLLFCSTGTCLTNDTQKVTSLAIDSTFPLLFLNFIFPKTFLDFGRVGRFYRGLQNPLAGPQTDQNRARPSTECTPFSSFILQRLSFFLNIQMFGGTDNFGFSLAVSHHHHISKNKHLNISGCVMDLWF